MHDDVDPKNLSPLAGRLYQIFGNRADIQGAKRLTEPEWEQLAEHLEKTITEVLNEDATTDNLPEPGPNNVGE